LQRAGSSFVPHPLVLSIFGTKRSFFFWARHSAVAVLSARGYHALLLHYFAMRKASFSSALAVPVFRSIIGKSFLTRRCSGFATLTAELIR
jgi:hypothetical protein